MGAANQYRAAPVQSARVIATYPHDPAAFTQGLLIADGELYESTGQYGESTLRRVELTTGKVLQRIALPPRYFAEGLALVGDALLQLTWREQTGFVYDRRTFEQRRTFSYRSEGWGLAFDGRARLAMSNGSETVTFLDPVSLAPQRSIRLRDGATTILGVNELEWVDDELWANIWPTDRIARIAPATGQVTAWIDLAALWPQSARSPDADVLNGIAYDATGKRVFVTGKRWPTLYQIAIP